MNKEELKKIYAQADAIFALEGFEKTDEDRRMDEAVLAGRITNEEVIQEMLAYIHEHKSLDGFVDSRFWI